MANVPPPGQLSPCPMSEPFSVTGSQPHQLLEHRQTLRADKHLNRYTPSCSSLGYKNRRKGVGETVPCLKEARSLAPSLGLCSGLSSRLESFISSFSSSVLLAMVVDVRIQLLGFFFTLCFDLMRFKVTFTFANHRHGPSGDGGLGRRCLHW